MTTEPAIQVEIDGSWRDAGVLECVVPEVEPLICPSRRSAWRHDGCRGGLVDAGEVGASARGPSSRPEATKCGAGEPRLVHERASYAHEEAAGAHEVQPVQRGHSLASRA